MDDPAVFWIVEPGSSGRFHFSRLSQFALLDYGGMQCRQKSWIGDTPDLTETTEHLSDQINSAPRSLLLPASSFIRPYPSCAPTRVRVPVLGKHPCKFQRGNDPAKSHPAVPTCDSTLYGFVLLNLKLCGLDKLEVGSKKSPRLVLTNSAINTAITCHC